MTSNVLAPLEEVPTKVSKIGASIAPLPSRRHTGILAELLLGIALLLDIGVALHARRPTAPDPCRVPCNGIAGYAVDLRTLRASTCGPAPAVRGKTVGPIVLGLVLSALLSGPLLDRAVRRRRKGYEELFRRITCGVHADV
ncbi:hypothetical protein KC340_g92 [Hortaea werneckii]|nr:hypothetical protein KC340_g92 [Hortaea werneckii]